MTLRRSFKAKNLMITACCEKWILPLTPQNDMETRSRSEEYFFDVAHEQDFSSPENLLTAAVAGGKGFW